MDFPTIHTNFWDAVIAVPVVMVITQLIKLLLKVPRKFIPTVAQLIGLSISIFISHRGHLVAGIFMGWFYGATAIGSYASLKTTIMAIRKNVTMGGAMPWGVPWGRFFWYPYYLTGVKP